jgi:hypothetical protein
MSSIAPRVEIGFDQLSEVLAHRHEPQSEGRAGHALPGKAERHGAFHPAAPDALLEQHRRDGAGGDVAQGVERGSHELKLLQAEARPSRSSRRRR